VTEQPEPRPILSIKALSDQMSPEERLALGKAIADGLSNARLAAMCLTDPDPQGDKVLEMLTYLTTAIRELSNARELIQRNS
jgi:hypothetical protein